MILEDVAFARPEAEVAAPASPQANVATDASSKEESSSLGAGAPAVTEDSYETNNQVSTLPSQITLAYQSLSDYFLYWHMVG